eukprot:COSAG06_NODE_10739_length_1626_cov_1.527177_1_plen_363_part_01
MGGNVAGGGRYPGRVTEIPPTAFSARASTCTSLTTVTIPNSVVTIGDLAFRGCFSLTTVTIPDSVETIGRSAFYGCTSLTTVAIPDSVVTIGDYAFYECTSLTTVTFEDSVVAIGEYAFQGCNSLTTVSIGDSVVTIGGGAFYCDASFGRLTTVTIGDSVENIGRLAFTSTMVCVRTDDGAAPTNLPWMPSCAMTCDEGTIFPKFNQLNPDNPTVAPECTICPFPERCPGGPGEDAICAAGSKGAGCSECMRGWFAFGGGCTECPKGQGAQLLAPVLGAVAGVIVIVGVWKLSATPETVEDAEGARENAATAAAIQGQVNNAVAFFGIAAFHLQLSAINLSLPGFPFPDMLRAIAQWMSNLFG